MTGRVVLDTGPLVALLDADEQHHEWAVEQLGTIRAPFLTCQAVIAEACYLLRRMDRAIAQIAVYLERDVIRDVFDFGANVQRAFRLMRKYRDVPMSLADACLVCLAEDTADSVVFTLDSDFGIYRYHGRRTIPTIRP